jgi:hypothetical protein
VLQIIAWFTPPGPELSVVSTYGPFAMPAYAMVERKPTPNDGFLELPVLTPPREITGYIRLSVKNIGDRPAEDTSLRCDYEGFYEIARDTGDISNGEFTKKIDIGKVEQNEEVSVSIWTFEEVSPWTEVMFSHKFGTTAHLFPEASKARYRWIGYVSTGILFFLAIEATMRLVQSIKRLRTRDDFLPPPSERYAWAEAQRQEEDKNRARSFIAPCQRSCEGTDSG